MIKTIKQLFKDFINKMEMRKYNEYTIEEYFRKKGYFVGKNNRILIRDFGSEPYLVKIGNHCAIAKGVMFITHDGGSGMFREEILDLNVFGKIEIKDNSFIGVNSIILPNVTIGPNSVVGAGAVVSKDVPPNTVVAGVPARAICTMDEYKKKCVKKWKTLNIKGPRETWKEQLIEYFWKNEKK